jgi:hypothetical protein
MAYFGKEFKFEKEENFDTFLAALGKFLNKSQVKNTLFNLGTYSYERQDIIQFALKRLPGG